MLNTQLDMTMSPMTPGRKKSMKVNPFCTMDVTSTMM